MQARPLEFAGEVACPCLSKIRGLAQVKHYVRLGVGGQPRRLCRTTIAMITFGVEGRLRHDRSWIGLMENQKGAILLMPDEIHRALPDDMDGSDGVVSLEQVLPWPYSDKLGRDGAQVIFHRR